MEGRQTADGRADRIDPAQQGNPRPKVVGMERGGDCRRPDSATEGERHGTGMESISNRKKSASREEEEEMYGGGGGDGDVTRAMVLDCSKHRDGSISSGTLFWHTFFRIADTRETVLEPMMMTNPTDCRPNRWACQTHEPCSMMQIFSLKLANVAVGGPVHLYGFLAVRDRLNPLRNYIFNRTRDDPFVVGQYGDSSVIQMAGPKRGIEMHSYVLIEFDMRIKNGDKQEDDLQLIDGAACFSHFSVPSHIYMERIEGDCGALDISFALFHLGVEATIQVGILQVHDSGPLNLSLTCSVSELPQEIQLFHDVIAKPCDLNRFVVAVLIGTALILRFKFARSSGGSDHVIRRCAFKPTTHGQAGQELRLDFATILVKVTWSTLVSRSSQ